MRRLRNAMAVVNAASVTGVIDDIVYDHGMSGEAAQPSSRLASFWREATVALHIIQHGDNYLCSMERRNWIQEFHDTIFINAMYRDHAYHLENSVTTKPDRFSRRPVT